MKKITLMLVAMLAAFAANAWTVKFTNPDNWTEVAAYCFNGDGEVLGKWPGTVMTQDADGLWTVSCEAGVPKKIIFNNNDNGSQTGDLDFVAGATYDKNGVVYSTEQEFTVYYDNTEDWSEVWVYTYSENGDNKEAYGPWPGTQITEKNSEGLYVWTIKGFAEPQFKLIIFNNGKASDSPEKKQTADLTYKVGATYDYSGLQADYSTWKVYLMGGPSEDWGTGVEANVDAKGIATFEKIALGSSLFKIKANDNWYGYADIELGKAVTLSTSGEGYGNLQVPNAKEGEEFNVIFNCKTNQITVSSLGVESAVATIEAANGEAVYFNMQGVRVANPENGLFIRVQNGKAVKVVK